MPKLWNETIEAHRRDVQAAVIDATAALIAENGLLSVTMSRIAEDSGIGRATLYKYFPDVESILVAWHERQMSAHLQYLTAVKDNAGNPADRLSAVLEAYALMVHQAAKHHGNALAALVHRPDRTAEPELQLRQMVQGLIAEAISSGAVRSDVPPDELAIYCVNALGAAGQLPSNAAVRRLAAVTVSGLRQ